MIISDPSMAKIFSSPERVFRLILFMTLISFPARVIFSRPVKLVRLLHSIIVRVSQTVVITLNPFRLVMSFPLIITSPSISVWWAREILQQVFHPCCLPFGFY